MITGSESIKEPLSRSALNKKSLCDYVINVASGCIHGCHFCYVPSTPMIRMRGDALRSRGVEDPQMDWGKYLFVRSDLPDALERSLSSRKTWLETPAGRGVVLLCSGTDPYQNLETAAITRSAVQTLLRHNKRVRILTRSPLWIKDLDILVHPDVTVGMSLPHLDDALSRQIEPKAPPPSRRLEALQTGSKAGCRVYVAMAPTPPMMQNIDFLVVLDQLMQYVNPEVIFWEPINARGTNGTRMIAAGLDWAKAVMTRKDWAENFLRQWEILEEVADRVGCRDRLHIWTDPDLKSYIDTAKVEAWWYRPTPETWLTR